MDSAGARIGALRDRSCGCRVSYVPIVINGEGCSAHQDDGNVVATIALTGRPDLSLALTVNGRSVTSPVLIGTSMRRTVVLGADDGVRHGRNVLRVVAASSSGASDTL